MLKKLILKTRSYRRFYQEFAISRETLVELVDLARLSPSAGNNQPLKYFLACDLLTNAAIFKHLAWAAYLKEWPGPPEGERPSAYIITLLKNVCKKIFLSHKLFRTQLMTFQCFTTCFALDLFLYSCY